MPPARQKQFASVHWEFAVTEEPQDFDEPLSGLSDDEARAFHTALVRGFGLFTLFAAIAHAMVWSWQPWLAAAGLPLLA